MHNSNNDKPDLTAFAAIENSTPLGLVNVDGAEMTPHGASRGFMDRLAGFGAEMVVNAYGGGAAGVVAGAAVGVVVAALSLSLAPLVVAPLVGAAVGLAMGAGFGATTGLFHQNKNDLTLRQRIAQVRENIVDMVDLRKNKANVANTIVPKV